MWQTGAVQLFYVNNGVLNVTHPLMTLTGDRELGRFGRNVIVSIVCLKQKI